jgi:ABC-2 type transport system permease protein
MRGFLAVFRKELRIYLNSPMAYVAVGLLLFATSGWLFLVYGFVDRNVASLREYFVALSVALAVVIPALTMRAWAEERQRGTDEVLLTLPVAEPALVLAKFAAPLLLVVGTLLLSIPLPLSVSLLGSFDTGRIAAEYVGLLLLACSQLSVGVFVSCLSRNQVSAYLVTVAVLTASVGLGQVGLLLSVSPPLAEALRVVSLGGHYHGFVRGVVDTRDVLFYAGLTFLGLYATVRALAVRKWGAGV